MSRYSLAYLLCLVVLVGCLVLCGPRDSAGKDRRG